MFKKVIATILLTVSSFVSADGFYAGVNYSFVDVAFGDAVSDLVAAIDPSGSIDVDTDVSLNTISTRLGVFLNDYLSFEFRYGYGLEDDTTGQNVDIDVKSIGGGYFRVGIPATEFVYPYVILGVTRVKLGSSFSDGNVSTSSSGSNDDFSYGLGVDGKISDVLGMNFEYTNYFSKVGFDITGFTLGLVWSF